MSTGNLNSVSVLVCKREVLRTLSLYWTMLTAEHIKKKCCLGRGAFGAVYKAEVKWPLEELYDGIRKYGLCAVKFILQQNHCLESDRLSLLAELQCKYIIRYLHHDAFETNFEPTTAIIMEFCPGGNLKDYLEKQDVCCTLMLQYGNHLSRALNYLHERNIIHTDIKSANVFLADLDASGLYRSVKLGDLDDPVIKKDVMTATSDIATYRGTCWYFSPEMAEKAYDNDVKVGSATDWWSLGCVLYEMAFGFESFIFKHDNEVLSPSSGITQHKVVTFIKDGGRPEIKDCCKHIKKALERCFTVDPKERAEAFKGKLLFEGAKDLDNVFFDAATPSFDGCTKHEFLLDKVMLGASSVDSQGPVNTDVKKPISVFRTRQFGYMLHSCLQHDDERTVSDVKYPRLPATDESFQGQSKKWVESVKLYANSPPSVDPSYKNPWTDYLKHLKRNHVYDNVPADIECSCSDETTNPNHIIKSMTLLGPIADIITSLKISSLHGCSILQLNHVTLPNLVCLTILDTVNVVIEQNTFAKFPKLKILRFIDCCFTGLHKNFLSKLKNLEFFGLTHSVFDSCDKWKAIGTIKFWQSTAVSSRYNWLYDYLSHHTELTVPKSVFTHVEKGFYRKTECVEFPWKDYSLEQVIHSLECPICMQLVGTTSRQEERRNLAEQSRKKRLLLRLTILTEIQTQ